MKRNKVQEESDFWWLTPDEAVKYKYLEVWHQEPYSDEPDSNKEPYSVPCFNSLDTEGNLSDVIKRYPLKFVEEWIKKCANINVFRSLGLFTAEQNGEELLGPFVIDIDRAEESDKGYVQNLHNALEATRQLVKKHLYQLKECDFRIFFTGHKGFNIEVRPQALRITSTINRRQEFEHRIKDINRDFGNNFVDKLHEHVRLHDSINRWFRNDGKIVNRMKYELSSCELNSLSADEICTKAERLASNYLESL